jgi:hypothetical protein
VEYGPQIVQMLRRPERVERRRDFQSEILQAEIRRLLGVGSAG